LYGLSIAAAIAPAAAQMQPGHPYVGLQVREAKTLSEEQLSDLKAGRGMGLALVADMNGYPGPRHVLDLADKLGLTEQQRTSIQQLFHTMKSEAMPIGAKLITAEKALNRQFAERTMTPERLQAATAAIAQIRGELQNTHLKYHLSTAALLSPSQITRYAELRGYRGAAATPSAHAGAASHMPGAMGGPMHQHTMGPGAEKLRKGSDSTREGNSP
jgi:hypothetical protein